MPVNRYLFTGCQSDHDVLAQASCGTALAALVGAVDLRPFGVASSGIACMIALGTGADSARPHGAKAGSLRALRRLLLAFPDRLVALHRARRAGAICRRCRYLAHVRRVDRGHARFRHRHDALSPDGTRQDHHIGHGVRARQRARGIDVLRRGLCRHVVLWPHH